MGAARSAETARLDALRRRLYAPDVTDDDVAAYRDASRQAEAAAPAPAAGSGSPARRVPRPGRRATALAGGGAVLLLAIAIAVLVTAHPLAAITAAGRTPTPTAPPSLVEGQITTSVAARLSFVQALQAGDEPGLLDYLYSHRAYLPPAISTPRRASSTEYAGQGSSTIPLEPSALTQHGGRVTVILVLDRGATYSWRAERLEERNDRSGPVLALAEQAGRARAGEPTTATFRYPAGAPSRLAVYLDETVKWGAVVVFTD